MARRLFLILHYLLFCSLTASAFDVTSILSQFSDFSTFTYLLARTRLADEINTQKGGVTVLTVQNGGLPIAAMSDQPDDVLKKILSLHVILDYLDATRLRRMSTHTAILTTLFQASGRASGFDGFLNVTDVDRGVAISSAAPGSPPGSYFVKVLATLPQSISVLQVSNVIFPPETGGAWSDGGRAVSRRSPAPAPKWGPTSPVMDPPGMGGVPPTATWSNIVIPPSGELSEPPSTEPAIIPAFSPEKAPSETPFSPSTAPSPPTPASMIGFPPGESPIVAPEQPDMPTWPHITLPPDASTPTPSTVAEEAPPAVSPDIAPMQPTRPRIGLSPRTSRRMPLAPGMAPALPTWPPSGSIVMGPTGPPSQHTPDIPPRREPSMGPTSPQHVQPLWPPNVAPTPFGWPIPRSPPGEAPARSQRTEPTESPSSSSRLPPGAAPPRKPPRMGPASTPVASRVPEMEPFSPEFPGGIVRLPPSLTPSASRRRLITKQPSEGMSIETNPTSTTIDPTSPPRTSETQEESQGVARVSVALAILAVLLGAFCL
ncbi:vegetative cell wall protein gp1-like [Zingiber officinale]|uniref:FAS1 domain-containing protein n=1 Tax=Zingiber officinale TaxID=94328 RepID=A0A8J5FF00_ZINOF|nr:vegetative cell wall protein gp1-like [Zingiber officinale]KAG6488472.1 hypothetical protein ZIOFF_049715 [Zingiber officinale]